MSTIPKFINLLQTRGSNVIFHRDSSTTACPCRTLEGYRDPEWHIENPNAPVCNQAGMLSVPGTTVDIVTKGFVQPIQSTRATRLTDERIESLFGEVQLDDHLGIFPITWGGVRLEFYDWGSSAEDYLTYNGRKFTVVNVNMLPDPSDGNPEHHWECGLRLIR